MFKSYSEIKKHNKYNDLWVILYEKVYDLTDYLKIHPGGDFLLQVGGKDGSGLFESIHSKSVKSLLESKEFKNKYFIGEISNNNNENNFNYQSILGFKLKDAVKEYFKNKENTYYAKGGLYEKLCVYGKFISIVSFSIWTKYKQIKYDSYIYSVLYGLCMILTIFNISHGANHGELVKRYPYWFNKISEYSQFILGHHPFSWKKWHNVSHHQHTNTIQDLDTNRSKVYRLHKNQKYLEFYKYQHIYTWFLIYPFTHIYAFVSQKRQYIKGYSFYFILNLFLSILICDKFNLITKLLIESFVFGFLFVLINHITHTNDKTEHSDISNSCWYENQLRTTANWSCRNYFITHLLGGINYQIEHHLFQSIHHYHYPALRNVIKKTIKDVNMNNNKEIPYHEFSNYFEALLSHYNLLKRLSIKEE